MEKRTNGGSSFSRTKEIDNEIDTFIAHLWPAEMDLAVFPIEVLIEKQRNPNTLHE